MTGAAATDATYPWPGGARAAVCFTLDFDAESPHLWRTREAPPAGVGELEQRRYGPRRGIANLLAMMADIGLRATVFVPGWVAENHRAQVEAVHAHGHELALHGWCHEPPTTLPSARLHRTLDRAARTLTDIAGARPVGYRSPSWDMTAEIFPVLHELGVTYDSSLMGDDRPYLVDGPDLGSGIVEVPVDWATDDAPYYRYTGGDPRPPATVPPVRAGWAAEIAAARRHGTLCMITVHPWLSGHPARVDALAELLAPVVADAEVCTPTVAELAAHHRGQEGGTTVTLTELGRPAHE